ncbi:pentatricopeptide repeat-containing protein At2g01510, mitochondrial-like [Selaginella moellendorffii]|uniref:pentatricopeptide repeat-containing protein At2g01510, mitochondrial-like n=1 Tax=Selaginella moellendorffii TaxID=88036 RepID=UPI000D1C2481|nr:pentatricopeptide repeat-containing protein At2g01510, mitochondrial-like [Selaginella moellendorffii]|eukprot:XP_024534286.1 pentatricopeptide repeat-containing protein At2g01510, mitochondrial-like [Selaginella moellendorffii]
MKIHSKGKSLGSAVALRNPSRSTRISAGMASSQVSIVLAALKVCIVHARCGSTADARLVFQSMQQRALVDLVSWNAMIRGYSENVDFLQWFLRMKDEGFQPDDRSFVAALKACASIVGTGEKEELMERKEDRTRALLESEDQVSGERDGCARSSRWFSRTGH